VTLCVVGAERGGALEPAQARVEIALEPVAAPHREIHERVQRVEFEASRRVLTGLLALSGDVVILMQEGGLEMHEGQARMSTRETGIERDCVLEEPRRLGVVRPVESVHVLQAEVIGRPGVEVLRDRETRLRGLVQRNLYLERGEQLSADLLAQQVNVVHRAGEALRPDQSSVAGVGELERDDEPPRRDFERARHAVTGTEQAADLEGISVRATQAKGRAPRDDEEPPQPCQLGDELVGQGVRDRGVRSGIAEQLQRQYGD